MPEIFGEKKDNKNYILWKASLVYLHCWETQYHYEDYEP